jgi:hypothetical protein
MKVYEAFVAPARAGVVGWGLVTTSIAGRSGAWISADDREPSVWCGVCFSAAPVRVRALDLGLNGWGR